MAKDKAEEAEDKDDAADGETPEGDGAEAKQGFIKKLLGIKLFANKKLLIIAGAALVLIIGGGAGAFFFLGGSKEVPKPTQTAQNLPPLPAVPPQVAFYDMPDIVVNIQTADSSQAFLKLSVALELDSAAEKPGIQAYMPRVVDQFQSYLRELRLDDLKGSAGVLRLKEELLRRINAVVAPYRVHDVLLKEMIVQ